jgi:serine phosphatase RsbU (regulator of sigma subunit)
MMAPENLSPADVLSKTNYHVARDIRRGMFVTMMYVILNVRTFEMVIASAGHNPLAIWRAASGQVELKRPNGIALGFDRGPVFNRTIQEQRIQLMRGDRVLLYTDGVVEAMNAEHEEWGNARLHRFLVEHAKASSRDFVRLLVQALQEHQGETEQHDDITVVTFRVAG